MSWGWVSRVITFAMGEFAAAAQRDRLRLPQVPDLVAVIDATRGPMVWKPESRQVSYGPSAPPGRCWAGR